MAVSVATDFPTKSSPGLKVNGRPAYMDAVEDVIFGSAAGVAGKYIEYPFDTVKVRLQSQPHGVPLRYSGPLDCIKQSFHSDGLMGFYRGISAPLVGAALETSSLFFFERVGREALYTSRIFTRDQTLPLSALFFTGAFSGAFTSLVLTPIELVKCKIQVPDPSNNGGIKMVAQSPLAVIREVYRYQGLRGFWNGQLGTLIRETGGCAAWFGSKETVTSLFHKLNAKKASAAGLAVLDPPAALPIWQQAVAGATAGMSYNFLFFPADTIKSRMQTVASDSTAAKPKFWQEGQTVYKQYGLKGLYRGCGITVVRSAPSSAFIFIIYDGLKNRFSL